MLGSERLVWLLFSGTELIAGLGDTLPATDGAVAALLAVNAEEKTADDLGRTSVLLRSCLLRTTPAFT